MKYTWLLFDADDTLFDFYKAEANALQWTLEQLGLPFRADYVGQYAGYNQQVWRQFERGELTAEALRVKRFQLFFEGVGLPGEPAVVSPLYLQNLALGSDLLEQADEVVHTLKTRYRLALVSNGLKEVQRPRLQRSRLNDCFEKVFISDELGAAKPAPAFFDIVFADLGRPAREQVAIIGDSLSSDMQGGINYNIDTCWYNPKGKTTELALTYQVNNLKELLSIF